MNDPYCLETSASPEVIAFESTGVQREVIPRALSMTRDEWIATTMNDYWHEIPAAERQRLAGGLWDRCQRLAERMRVERASTHCSSPGDVR